MRIFNPCNKCIVRACCSELCEDSAQWNKMYLFITQPIDLLKDLYKSKEWVLLSVMVFLQLFLVASVGFHIVYYGGAFLKFVWKL